MNKRKIGLLSVYNHNYGSILQAYALQTVLQSLGNDTEIILYKKTNLWKQAKRLLYFPLLKAAIKMKWKEIYCKIYKKKDWSMILKSREQEFADFINQYLKFSKLYKGRKKLIEGCANYDCFVLGSDQVWNPMNIGSDFYTMTFIPDSQNKIAYAPSFGVSAIPEKQKEITKKYLNRINYISVREIDGAKIIKDLTGHDVPVVVDPTILVDKNIWDSKLEKRLIEEEYIFCYFISNNAAYRDFAKRLSKKTGIKILTIPHVDEFVRADVEFGDILPKKIGPLQFVNLISNAAYVCTDSFHGTVFSILYKRIFYVFNRYSGNTADSTNSRLHSFLKLMNMENRIYDAKKEIKEYDLKSVDFTNTLGRLEALRKESRDYLVKALNNIEVENGYD